MMDVLFTFKSAKKDYPYPVIGINKGEVPTWIKGSLYRNGPGKFEVGPDKYKHAFDGLAMVQRYYINDGKVAFNSQYIHSKTYLQNMAANRIVVSEFGTMAYPDPCHTIFNKLSVLFEKEYTDNTSVCVFPIGDELFTSTETAVIHRIDPIDLSTIGSVRLSNILAINRATAHQHIDSDTGVVHFLGFVNSPTPSYAFVSLPPIKKQDSSNLREKYDMEKLLTGAKIIGKIPTRWKLNPSYYHSFGITENYFILLECPLTLSILDLLKSKVTGTTFAKALKWWPQEKTIIYIMNKKTGVPLSSTYMTDALFTFHHINAYEDEGHIVIDYCGYEDASVIISLFTDSLENKPTNTTPSLPKRLVIPILFDEKVSINANLVSLSGTTCTARIIEKQKNKCILYCTQEKLSVDIYMELPTINYFAYNGKKYRYFYGVFDKKLIKVDHVTKESTVWSNEEQSYVCESVFVKNPNADDNNPEDEDNGVLLTPVITRDPTVDTERYQSLVFIDARSMKEISRVEFPSVSIPFTFHGVFQSLEIVD